MNKANKQTSFFDFNLFKLLLTFVKPYKSVFLASLFFVCGVSIFGALRPKVLKIAIDDKVGMKDYSGFLDYLLIMLTLLVLEVVFQVFFIYAATTLGQSVVKDIRVKLFSKITSFKMKYFNTSSVGVLITRTVTDMERIGDIFGDGLFMIVSDLLKMSVVSIVMISMNWKLSLVVFCALPIILFATKIFQRLMKKAFEEVRSEVSNLNSFVQERIVGMKVLQLFAREDIEMNSFKEINGRHKKGWLKTVWYNSIFFPVAELISASTLAIIIYLGGIYSVLGSTASQGELFAFIVMVPMIFRPLNQIANKFNSLQMGMVAADRVFKVLKTESIIDDKGEFSVKNIEGNIEFKDVEFSYVENQQVLKGVSFNISKGKTIAIVGATGAGKSTIINLLSRFYDVTTGDILIDNKSIKEYELSNLRSHIAVVLQDVFLFADSILNNITLNDTSISKEVVVKAAKEIGIHDFIESLPEGYNYNVRERGVMLSAGQRQLISFLRAYVTNPQILVLDEATSSVDTFYEKLIKEATAKITQNRTSVVIAHRLATIKNADEILVMDAGKIVERGSHNELLKIDSGFYKKLYDVQFVKEEVI